MIGTLECYFYVKHEVTAGLTDNNPFVKVLDSKVSKFNIKLNFC